MGNPTGKGGFKKGQSGNPGGRKKEVGHVKEMAQQYTAEAVDRLVHWMREGDGKTSRAAAEALLDRAWGRPAQAHEHTGADGGPIEAKISLSFE